MKAFCNRHAGAVSTLWRHANTFKPRVVVAMAMAMWCKSSVAVVGSAHTRARAEDRAARPRRFLQPLGPGFRPRVPAHALHSPGTRRVYAAWP